MNMIERQPVDERLLDNYFLAQYHNADHARLHHEDLAAQLTSNGNSLFLNEAHVQYVQVPLAAARESHTEQTLNELAEQVYDAPESAAGVISFNTPQKLSRAGRRQARDNAEVIDTFIAQHPDVPISYFKTQYQPGTTIGAIRNDIYGAVIQNLRKQYGTGDVPDVLMTSWDADTLKVTKGYIADTQHHYARSDAMAYRSYPLLRHAQLDNDAFPNANRLLAWYDLIPQVGRGAAPAHFTVNLGTIGMAGGMARDTCGEQVKLWSTAGRHAKRFGGQTYSEALEYHRATVSPRQLVGKMALDRRVDYGGLTVQSVDGPQYAVLKQDVQEDIYNRSLMSIVATVYNRAYSDKVYMLHQEGVKDEDAHDAALTYAQRYITAAASIIGNVHDTRTIVEAEINGYANTW